MFITFFYNKHIIGHEQRTNEYFEPVHFSYVSDVWSSSTQHIWIHFYNACSIWSEAHKSMLDVGQCSWSPEITNTKMECPFYFLFAVSVFLVFSILFLLAFTRSLSSVGIFLPTIWKGPHPFMVCVKLIRSIRNRINGYYRSEHKCMTW